MASLCLAAVDVDHNLHGGADHPGEDQNQLHLRAASDCSSLRHLARAQPAIPTPCLLLSGGGDYHAHTAGGAKGGAVQNSFEKWTILPM